MFYKSNNDKSYNDLKRENDTIKQELKEKDDECNKLREMKIQLEELLRQEKVKNQDNRSSFRPTGNDAKIDTNSTPNFLGIMTLGLLGNQKNQDELGKLQQQYNYLRKQHETVLDKLNKAENYIEKVRSEFKQKSDEMTESLEKKTNELSAALTSIDDQKKQISDLSKENKKIFTANTELIQNKAKLEEENKNLKRELDTVKGDNTQLTKDLEESEKLCKTLTSACSNMEAELGTLREKTQGFDFFNIKRVPMKVFNPIPCHLILRKNVNNDYLIELENPAEKITLHPEQIMTYSITKDSKDKFNFSYLLKGKVENEIFIVNSPVKLFESLDAFVQTAKRVSRVSTTGSKKEKNLISEVVGFFSG